MSRIANHRALAEAMQALVRAAEPKVEHYAKLLPALARVVSDDVGEEMMVKLEPVGERLYTASELDAARAEARAAALEEAATICESPDAIDADDCAALIRAAIAKGAGK